MVSAQQQRKRTAGTDSGDEGGNRAESSLSPAKRVKLERLNNERQTPEEDADMSMDSQDVDEDDLDDEEMDDDDDEEPEDEEAEMRAYERQRQSMGQVNVGSEAGAVKSMVLVDFMCHRHLKVDFAPRMNFLVGHNGCGKSAILTAFSIVMGGKASVTGRGAGLKELIRKGTDKAIITATIANKGWEAFKPEVYGDRIIIERVITKTGGSFKMRGSLSGNKVISTKKEELVQMTSVFQMSIDSPLTVLTQDKARSFLANADERQLYRFFMEGTGLFALSQQYDQVHRTFQDLRHLVQKKRDGLPALQAKLKQNSSKIATAGEIERQKQKSVKLKQELGWAFVTQKEAQRDEALANLVAQKEKLVTIRNNAEQSETRKAELDEDFNVVNEELEAMKNAEKPLQDARKIKHAALRAGIRSKDEMQDELNELRRMMDEHDKTVADLNRQIERKKRDIGEGGMTAQQREDDRLLTELEAKRNKLQPQLGLKEQVIADRKAQLAQLEDQINDANARCMESNRDARAIENDLERMQRQTNNRLSVFGQNIEIVLKAIDRAQWHVKPIGPLGMFVELKDMQYRDVLQSQLGSSLCTWAVQDGRDRPQLMNILKRAADQGYRPASGTRVPSIISNSAELFDFSAGDLSRHGQTVISKLEVSDPYVLRCLVNSAKIEKTFLAPDNTSANRELDRLKRAMPGQSVRVLSADRFEHTGQGTGSNVGPIQEWRAPPLFTRNMAADIDEMRAKASAIRHTEAQHRDAQRAFVDQRKAIEAELQRETANFQMLKTNLPKFEQRIEELREKLAQNPSDEIGGLESYRREELNKKAAIESQYHACENTINDTILPDLEKLKAEAAEAKEQHENYIPQLMKKRDALEEIARARDKERGVAKHWETSKRKYAETKQAAEATLEKLEQELEDWIQKAREYYDERIPTTRSVEAIKSEREAINKAIQSAERTHGVSVEDLMLVKRTLEKEISDIQTKTVDLYDIVKIGELAMISRRNWWDRQRQNLSIGLKCGFTINCSKRKFYGRIDMDHATEQLDVKVQTTGALALAANGGVPPEGDDAADPDGDGHTQEVDVDGNTRPKGKLRTSAGGPEFKVIKSLSGGEKSFVTVSLLLAMWDGVSGPVKCLDEWDVFLDDVNRAVTAKMLDQMQKQFILITPQNVSNVKDHLGVEDKIIKLDDPIRNQGTLDFGAA